MIPVAAITLPSALAGLATSFALGGGFRLRNLGIVALLAAVIAVFVPSASTGFLAWSAAMVLLLSALAVFDAETLTVPDALTIPLIATGMLHAALNLAEPAPFLVAPIALVGAGWLAGKLAGEGRFAWLGGGDVLIAAGALAWLGPFVFADYLLVAGVLVVLLAAAELVLHCRGTPRFALAPASAIAQISIWFGGPIL